MQVVKGWIDADGTQREKVYDVAGDGGSGASVDTATCAPAGDGWDRLCAAWTDPDFDPALQAFYYARVLENPVCRWSAWDCLGLDPADRPASCTDDDVARVIQERAWSSPVWYVP